MARARLTDREVLAQIPAAEARARRAHALEPHAIAAHYDRRTRTLRVTLTNGGGFTIPVALIAELRRLTDQDIATVRVGAAGVALRWARLDIDLSVAGLARTLFGAAALMRVAGAAGGSVRSTSKAAAARRNGRKGGRPAKVAAGRGTSRQDARRRA